MYTVMIREFRLVAEDPYVVVDFYWPVKETLYYDQAVDLEGWNMERGRTNPVNLWGTGDAPAVTIKNVDRAKEVSVFLKNRLDALAGQQRGIPTIAVRATRKQLNLVKNYIDGGFFDPPAEFDVKAMRMVRSIGRRLWLKEFLKATKQMRFAVADDIKTNMNRRQLTMVENYYDDATLIPPSTVEEATDMYNAGWTEDLDRFKDQAVPVLLNFVRETIRDGSLQAIVTFEAHERQWSEYLCDELYSDLTDEEVDTMVRLLRTHGMYNDMEIEFVEWVHLQELIANKRLWDLQSEPTIKKLADFAETRVWPESHKMNPNYDLWWEELTKDVAFTDVTDTILQFMPLLEACINSPQARIDTRTAGLTNIRYTRHAKDGLWPLYFKLGAVRSTQMTLFSQLSWRWAWDRFDEHILLAIADSDPATANLKKVPFLLPPDICGLIPPYLLAGNQDSIVMEPVGIPEFQFLINTYPDKDLTFFLREYFKSMVHHLLFDEDNYLY